MHVRQILLVVVAACSPFVLLEAQNVIPSCDYTDTLKRRFTQPTLDHHCQRKNDWFSEALSGIQKTISDVLSPKQFGYLSDVQSCLNLTCVCGAYSWCRDFLKQLQQTVDGAKNLTNSLTSALGNATKNLPGADALTNLGKNMPGGDLTKQSLGNSDAFQNLAKNLPGADSFAKNFPGADALKNLNNGAFGRRRKRQGNVPLPSENTPRPVKPAVRKEYRAMTSDERDRFHKALNTLKFTQIDGMSKYDILTVYHTGQYSPGAHFGAAFLPWHREFLKQIEVALRLIDADVFMPYWDSTLDEGLPQPADSVLWTPELLGNNRGDVTTGPFAKWVVQPNPKFPLTTRGHRLTRNVTGSGFGTLFKPSDRQTIFSKAHFRDFVYCIDPYFELVHGGTHMWVGGHMLELETSPNDPSFFMLHAYVDYLWEKWRQRRSPSARGEYTSKTDSCTQFHYADSPMKPFRAKNIDGMSEKYVPGFYTYEDSPTDCSRQQPTCGDGESPYLFCDWRRGRCLSKVAVGGRCAGLEQFDVCYNGECVNGACRATQVTKARLVTTTTTEASTTASSAPVTTTTDDAIMQNAILSATCLNRHRCCPHWSAKGLCVKNEFRLGTWCSKSCNRCIDRSVSRNSCTDSHEKCPSWAARGECTTTAWWMDDLAAEKDQKTTLAPVKVLEEDDPTTAPEQTSTSRRPTTTTTTTLRPSPTTSSTVAQLDSTTNRGAFPLASSSDKLPSGTSTFNTVWFPITVLQIVSKNKAESVPAATIITRDLATGVQIRGVLATDRGEEYPFYEGSAFARMEDPANMTAGKHTLRVTVLSNYTTDDGGRMVFTVCEQMCRQPTTLKNMEKYDSCTSPDDVITINNRRTDVNFTPHFDQAPYLNWHGPVKVPTRYLFVCPAQNSQGRSSPIKSAADHASPDQAAFSVIKTPSPTSNSENIKVNVNRHRCCTFWASVGECQRNSMGMGVGCPLACQTQKNGSEACNDLFSQCSSWAASGHCKDNPLWMEENCRVSCKVCGRTNADFALLCGGSNARGCKDLDEKCASWAKSGECAKNSWWMNQNCAASCGCVGKSKDA